MPRCCLTLLWYQTKNIVYRIIRISNGNDSFASLPSPSMELVGIMDVNLHFLSFRHLCYLKHKHTRTHIHTYSPLQAKPYDKLDWVWYILCHAHRIGIIWQTVDLRISSAPLKSFLIMMSSTFASCHSKTWNTKLLLKYIRYGLLPTSNTQL